MSGFNDFMDRAGALAFKAAEKAKDLASVAAAKTKQVSRVAKLNMDISAQKDAIKKAYGELGQQYYQIHKDDPEAALAEVCRQIDEANAAIASLEEEIARCKADMEEADEAQDGDFSSVVDQTEAEADVIVQVVEEEMSGADAPQAGETPAEPAEPAEPAAPEAPHEEEPRWE